MASFVLQRLVTLIATLLGASAVVFVVLEVLPGNAAQVLLGPDAAPEAVAALAAQLGLDQPALVRYGQWMAGLLTGRLGDSHAYSAPVLDLIAERLALTVPLALLSMLLTCALALAAGVYAAARHGRLGDWGVMGLAQVGIVDAADGAKIVTHIFGEKQEAVATHLADATPSTLVSASTITKLLPILAPIVLSLVGKAIFGGKSDEPAAKPKTKTTTKKTTTADSPSNGSLGGLGDLLGGLLGGGSGSSSGGLGDLLGGLGGLLGGGK